MRSTAVLDSDGPGPGPGPGRPRPEALCLFDELREPLHAHQGVALFGLTDTELGEAIEAREQVARELDALDLQLIREADGRGVAQREGATGTAVWLRGRVLCRPADAAARVRVAAALDT
ncbi:MAG: hypothetical protein ACQSGP_31235, partial [Frankia sp.]